ncbi:MAG: hypothetical protein NWE99_01615 [Candidatus Bathyarchaeota archaeon]|nr:hypothetical protein [Candidatus Bathyarchaeota archaeon]
MYSVWIKIDNSLPWIELEENFQTRAEARAAMKGRRSTFKAKIVKVSK